jgi:hypothetical protein
MPTSNKPSKPKAVIVTDRAFVDMHFRKITNFRETAKLKDATGYVKGTASYCLYAVDFPRSQVIVLADSPTSSDFNQYVTAKAKANACSRYDHIIEWRDTGSHANPKVAVLVWELV